MNQLTLIRFTRDNCMQSITLPVGFPGFVETQVRLLLRCVRPMAREALRGKDREHLPVVFHFSGNGQQTAQKKDHT